MFKSITYKLQKMYSRPLTEVISLIIQLLIVIIFPMQEIILKEKIEFKWIFYNWSGRPLLVLFWVIGVVSLFCYYGLQLNEKSKRILLIFGLQGQLIFFLYPILKVISEILQKLGRYIIEIELTIYYWIAWLLSLYQLYVVISEFKSNTQVDEPDFQTNNMLFRWWALSHMISLSAIIVLLLFMSVVEVTTILLIQGLLILAFTVTLFIKIMLETLRNDKGKLFSLPVLYFLHFYLQITWISILTTYGDAERLVNGIIDTPLESIIIMGAVLISISYFFIQRLDN